MNAAIDYYKRIRKAAPRRTDLVINDLAKYANRACAMDDVRRKAILTDAARLQAGDVACPACGHTGPHSSNKHHRIGQLAFICAGCNETFKATEIES